MHARPRRGARLLFGTAAVSAAALLAGVGAGTAQAAPRDNIASALRCLNGGWRTFQTTAGRPLPNLALCVVYALSGRQLVSVAPPPPPPSPTPTPTPTPKPIGE